MGESKHTPGPWDAETAYASPTWVPLTGLQPVRCVMNPTGDVAYLADSGLTSEEVEANARLISAAPDLLAACEWMLRYVRNGLELGYIAHVEAPDTARDAIPMLEAVIAKAKGEQANG